MRLDATTIVFGDIHGEEKWEDIVTKHPDAQYIFLGDYCDPYLSEYTPLRTVNNLKKIISLKKERPDDVILLLGNHDTHYIYPQSGICSRFMIDADVEIRTTLKENIELFCNAFTMGRLLFTHAGVSEEWLNYARLLNDENLVPNLNSPEICPEIFDCGAARGGSKPYSGIFWSDISEMNNPLKGYVQIVGHTRIEQIKILMTDDNTAVIFCDSLWNNNYLIIEGAQEGSTIKKASLLTNISESIYTL